MKEIVKEQSQVCLKANDKVTISYESNDSSAKYENL